MVNIISFDVEGDYAAFRDPGITTNQAVYSIPSKSAVIGLLSAILGYYRPNTLGDYSRWGIYTDEFLNLLRETQIGIKVRSKVIKYAFFTNHRSLKETKTKPFKTELLLSPKYTMYVKSNEDVADKLFSCLKGNNFAYTPILGHAYCLARLSNSVQIEGREIDPIDVKVKTVILDEAIETNNFKSSLEYALDGVPTIIIERHLHHFFTREGLDRKVLRHWIPLSAGDEADSMHILAYKHSLNLVRFYELNEGEVICLY